jgi:kynurenine formamidase
VKIVDLSREMYHRTPSYPGHPPVIHGVWKTHEESLVESGNVHGLSSMFISMPDHAGTHIDAFRHFDRDGQPIGEYPLENCIVPASASTCATSRRARKSRLMISMRR